MSDESVFAVLSRQLDELRARIELLEAWRAADLAEQMSPEEIRAIVARIFEEKPQ